MKVARVSIIENTSEEAVYVLKNYYAKTLRKFSQLLRGHGLFKLGQHPL